MSDYASTMYADSDAMIDGLQAQHDAGMQRMYHIFEFLFAADVLSGLWAWQRNRQQSPEALAQRIASEYGL